MSLRLKSSEEKQAAAAAAKLFDEYMGAQRHGRGKEIAEKSGLPQPIITKLRKHSIHQFSIDHAIAIEQATDGEIKAEDLLVPRSRALLAYYRGRATNSELQNAA